MRLLAELKRLGFTLTVEGDAIRVYHPSPTPPLEARPLLDELRQRKAEVLAALRGREQPAIVDRPTPTPAGECPVPGWRLADIPPENQAAEVRRRLDTQGWCALLARRIGEGAVVVLCEDPAKVPAPLRRRFPTFTLGEVATLHAEGGLEALSRAYEERLLPGEEVAFHV